MKLGFCVRDLGPSQLSYCLVKNANALLRDRPTLDIIAFFETPTPACLPANFAQMPLSEGWGYDGVMVATTFGTAKKLLSFPGPLAKCFYVWDLEWTRGSGKSYEEQAAVYRHKDLRLLARGPDHSLVIEQCWNRPVAGLVPDVDLHSLLAILEAF